MPGVLTAFLDDMRIDVDQWLAGKPMTRCVELAAATGEDFDPLIPPMFFTGDFEADLVLVHLNPKRNGSADPTGEPTSFDDYVERHRYFGRLHYGPDALDYRSQFDAKQARFLRPFGVIDFVEERRPADRRVNLERVIDHKLQLELVPYASNSFNGRGVRGEAIDRRVRLVLDVIGAHPRRVVLFCGSVFERLLNDYIAKASPVEQFALPKRGGGESQYRARFGRIELSVGSTRIHAGIAHSFAMQGIDAAGYGAACAERWAD